MKQIRDYKKQCTGIYFSFSLLLLRFWGAWSWWEINCSAKLTSFRRGVYVIDSKILELRILSKDLFPTLLYCSAMKATISVPYIHVCHAVLSTSCASALSKNTCTRQSHGENATNKTGRPYKPCIKHICSKYCCFQSHIVLLKAFSLYLCF